MKSDASSPRTSAPNGPRWGQRALVLGFVAAAVFHVSAVVQAGDDAPDDAPGKSALVAEVKLHGDTPTMAWSPDSKHVVASAAYDYIGAPSAGDAVGLFVMNVSTAKVSRPIEQQAYHPLWLDGSTLAWTVGPYESTDANPQGLYKMRHDGAKPTRVGTLEGVYNPKLGPDGKIVFWNGWPGYQGWLLADPNTGTTQGLQAPKPEAWGESWDTPAVAIDQCVQKVGNRVVEATASAVVVLDVKGKGKSEKRTEVAKFDVSPYDYQYSGAPAGHSGLIEPCLSPDGKHLSVLVNDSGLALRVYTLP